MSVKIIVAVDSKGGIGKDGGIPWKNSADMKWFKTNTVGNTCIMGRGTFESMGSKPLPNRRNIVISTTIQSPQDGSYEVYSSLEKALDAAQGDSDVFLIGGNKIYSEGVMRGVVDYVYMTSIGADYKCDTFFLTEDAQAKFKTEFDLLSINTLEDKKTPVITFIAKN